MIHSCRILYAMWPLISSDGQRRLVILQCVLKNPDPGISWIYSLMKPSSTGWSTRSTVCCR